MMDSLNKMAPQLDFTNAQSVNRPNSSFVLRVLCDQPASTRRVAIEYVTKLAGAAQADRVRAAGLVSGSSSRRTR